MIADWVVRVMAAWIQYRRSGKGTLQSVRLLAGFLAGVFGFLFSLIGMAGAASLVRQLN
jgi:hypothetical protein